MTGGIAVRNPYANSKLNNFENLNAFGRDTLTLDEIVPPTLRQEIEQD